MRGYPLGKSFMFVELLLYTGQYGKHVTRLVLTKSLSKNPLDIIYHACALMTYWAGLYGEPDREQLVEGINTMLKIAEKILKRKRGDTEAVNRLQDGEPDGHDDASI